MAASVSTLVVSWKEAAEMKLSVERDALVMPSSSGSAMAGCCPLCRPFVLLLEDVPFHLLPDQEFVSPRS